MLSVSVTFEKNPKKSYKEVVSIENTFWREVGDLRLIAREYGTRSDESEFWQFTTHDRADFEAGWGNNFFVRVCISEDLPKASFYIEPHVFVELEYIE